MQLEQSFELPLVPAQTWKAFGDIALLVDCLPGASLTGPAVDGAVPMRFDVKLGPIAAAFVGSGQLALDDGTQSGRFEGTASDRRTNSRVKGSAAFTVQAIDTGSRVTVLVDYALTGSLAQFNRGGIVRELASALTTQFAGNLSQRLQADAAANAPDAMPADITASTSADPAPSAAPSTPATPTTVSKPPASLDGWSLLRQVLKARWSRWIDRILGRNTA